jgi:acyl-coenzyme A synthetase/AMP-(fatty) acid ligase
VRSDISPPSEPRTVIHSRQNRLGTLFIETSLLAHSDVGKDKVTGILRAERGVIALFRTAISDIKDAVRRCFVAVVNALRRDGRVVTPAR